MCKNNKSLITEILENDTCSKFGNLKTFAILDRPSADAAMFLKFLAGNLNDL